jgi:hypothetical protein
MLFMASVFKPTKPYALPEGAEIIDYKGKPSVRLRGTGNRLAVYPLTQCGTKYLKPTSKWYGQYRDERGIVRRVPLATDKAVAQQKLAEIERRVERIKLGLHDPAEDQAHRPLADHLHDYMVHLRAKGSTADHVRRTTGRIRALLEGVGAVHLRDVCPVRVSDWLTRQRAGETPTPLPKDGADFSPGVVAKLLGVSRESVNKLVRRLGIQASGNGRARRISAEGVRAIL